VPTIFVPARGDLVKLSFSPQSGREQAGWRPAFVVSPETYNRASSLALFCPVTSRSTGYPFDWRARRARFVGRAPAAVLDEVLARLAPLVT